MAAWLETIAERRVASLINTHIYKFRGKLQTHEAIGRSKLRISQKLVCSCLLHKIIISCTKVSVPRLHANNTGVSIAIREFLTEKRSTLSAAYKISILLLLWRCGCHRKVSSFLWLENWLVRATFYSHRLIIKIYIIIFRRISICYASQVFLECS